MRDLCSIDAAVALRSGAISAEFPDWPCRKGCDHCCRNLSMSPLLTGAEWVRLHAALRRLPSGQRRVVEQRIAAVIERPIVCPLLDRESGACLTYESRPVACRTYGFYADREGGLYCGKVESFSAGLDGIIWGNQEAVEAGLDGLGIRRTLREWFLADRR